MRCGPRSNLHSSNWMDRFSRKRLALLFRVALVAGVVVFFVLFLKGLDYSRLEQLQLAPLALLASAALSLAFRYWGVFIWRGILKDLGSTELPKFRVLARIYAQSWMARYVPGTVTWIAGRVVLASNLGISKSRLTVASLLEAGIQVVAIAATSMLLLSLDERINAVVNAEARRLVLVIGLLLLLILVPSVFNRIIRFAYQIVRGQEAYAELAANGTATVRSFVLYVFGSFISGLSYYFLAVAVWGATSAADLIYIVGAVNLAAVIGMATPFVPSGLGTRDASLLILLAGIFPDEIALAITIFSRLWTAIIDVLFLAIASWQGRTR